MSTPRTLDGNLSAKDLRVGIIASRFNGFIVERLVDGAVETLLRLGADVARITVARCPGAFEIPQVARRLLETGRFDALICLGCIIRGATPHFDYVAAESAKGVAQLGMSSKIPVTFGILTTDNIEQAVERAGAKAGNKGADVAMAAVELASLYDQIGKLSG